MLISNNLDNTSINPSGLYNFYSKVTIHNNGIPITYDLYDHDTSL